MTENGTCKDHRMICSEIVDLKDIVKSIEGKVGTGQMWAVVVVFIMVTMAIVGFLYQGQTSVRTRLEAYQEKVAGDQGILTKIDKRLDHIEWTLGEQLKVEKRERR